MFIKKRKNHIRMILFSNLNIDSKNAIIITGRKDEYVHS